jgi:two-component system response regulator CpxR
MSEHPMEPPQTIASERVLVIDDDVELCRLVTRFMAGEGFTIDCVTNGGDGVARALSGDYALVMLDVMMPDVNGFDVLRRIRAASRMPVLMLTARGDTLDRVLGLEMGADDYLPKPFDPSELAARIRAILRRSQLPPGSAASAPAIMVVDDVDVDPGTRVARLHGTPVDLTTVEFDLLAALIRSAGRTVTRESLAQDVLGRAFSPFDRSLDTHVCNLRRKLGPLKDGTERIKGVRGTGYLYSATRTLPASPP